VRAALATAGVCASTAKSCVQAKGVAAEVDGAVAEEQRCTRVVAVRAAFRADADHALEPAHQQVRDFVNFDAAKLWDGLCRAGGQGQAGGS